jgi:hypothetical protein
VVVIDCWGCRKVALFVTQTPAFDGRVGFAWVAATAPLRRLKVMTYSGPPQPVAPLVFGAAPQTPAFEDRAGFTFGAGVRNFRLNAPLL